MRIRTFALGGLVAAAAMLVALFASPAGAQDYPPTGPTVTLNATTVAQGGTLSGSLANFDPGEGTAEYNPTFAVTVAADGTGTFSHQIAADQAPGDYTLTVTSGTTTGTATFTVTAAGSGGGGDLPRTGTDGSLPMAQTAVAAIAAGGLMVLVANKRRQKANA